MTKIRKEQISSGSATNGQVLTADGAGGVTWDEVSPGDSIAFIDLTDTPISYSGEAGNFVRVTANELGLEFITISGGGDMLKADYDSDNDGVVDEAAAVEGVGTAGNSKYYGTNSSGTPGYYDITSGSGYAEGTSFPESPATNDKFYRTDRNLLYYYDGTRWLTTQMFIIAPSVSDTVATATVDIGRLPVWTENGGMYLVSVKLSVYVATTNNGSNYWTAKLIRASSNNTQNDVVSGNTSADSADTWYEKNLSINAVLDSTARAMKFRLEKTGSPGNMTFAPAIIFRLIG